MSNIDANTKIEFTNTLRGLAALFVVLSHYLSTFWYKRDSVAHLIHAPLLSPETHATPFYVVWLNLFPLFDWGAYGVGLFFIISGFVIPFSLLRTTSVGFCVNRLFRIIPTYVIGFSITLFALFLCGKYFLSVWAYSFQEVFIHYIPGVRDILESRNIDVIIWTLEVEMKFYLIVALSIAWFRNNSLKVFLIPAVLFLATCYMSHMIPVWAIKNLSAFIRAEIYMMSSPYIIFMFIGVVFHYLYCHKIASDTGYFLIGILFVMFCIAWWTGPYSENLILAWSYAFALLTFMFAYTFPHFFKANPLVNFLADISYPLYIVHSIAGYVVLRVMLDMNFKIWTALALVFIGSLLLSWLLHVFIERPTQRLGKKYAAKRNTNSLKKPALLETVIKLLRIKQSRELT
ncbi:acyltransferase [Legionella anisa]|uniref:Acyltransferase n=1 Tax=Legionella anisa TaxID=28082 RepID=A0AAX0WWU6_9GAMM|nr:acyltransferase [Legionella anisa]AWN74333.1 acyltransferase [Legionella anisa]KTC71987.1 acyltransferase [Legionella anisa]MCW8425570.1 acyltransferase [Legionella anisa]MCW8449000.1 acyltransferase [Legionella anisa]PNL61771.1 acyltransferase [Legionella anisa]